MTFKKLSVAIIFSLFIGFVSCKKEEALVFDYHGDELYLTLDPDTTNPTSYKSRGAVYFNADSMAKANNFPMEAVQSISLNSIRFTLMDSINGITFNLIKDMSVFLATTPTATGEKLFQNSNFTKKTDGTISVTGIDKDIKSIVTSNKYFYLDVSGELTDTLTKKIIIKAFFTYNVDMKGKKLQ